MSEIRSALAPAPVVRPHMSLGIVVAMSCLAQFMVVLDSTIVTVALPAVGADLHLSTNQQQWVVTGYLVSLGGFLLLAARASDLVGRKPVFLFGTVVFTAASLVGGLATGPTTLLIARIVQGIGAAALAPSSLSLITASHTDDHRRHKALALWSVMGGSASAIGVVLGGVLTAEWSWRWVFFINVPLGLGLFVAASLSLLPAPGMGDRDGLDVPGALCITLGMGALVYGLSQVSPDGWGSVNVIVSLIIAAVLTSAFVVVEATAARPLIPLALFRARSLCVGNLLMGCLGVTMTATLFFLSLYLQDALGYSALRTGLALLPMTIILVVGGLASRKLIPMVGPRLPLVVGALIATAGLTWLAWLPDQSAYLANVLGPTLVAGAGLSLMLLSVTLAATTGVDPKDAGAASGLLNTARQLGGAIGLAVLVTVAAGVTRHDSGHASHLDALVHGYRAAIVVIAAVTLAAALAACALPRPRVVVA